MDLTEKKVSSETLFSGKIIRVTLDKAKLSNGKIVNREVAYHSGGVAVLPFDKDGNCYLVRQYRYPCEKLVLEAPAGKIDPNEEPLTCGKRELSEETGFTSDQFIYCGNYYSSPGFTNELLHVYIALNVQAGESHPDENEFVNVEKYSFDELLQMLDDGKIEDAKTAIAILQAYRYFQKTK